MSEMEVYCFYCEALKAKDAGEVHVQILQAEHNHAGEKVFTVRVVMGGTRSTCEEFAAMVDKHVREALGNDAVVTLTPKPQGKPN